MNWIAGAISGGVKAVRDMGAYATGQILQNVAATTMKIKEGIATNVINVLLEPYLKYLLLEGQTKTESGKIEVRGTEAFPWVEFDEEPFNVFLAETPLKILAIKAKKLKIEAPLRDILVKDVHFAAEDVVIVATTDKKAGTLDTVSLSRSKTSNNADLNSSFRVADRSLTEQHSFIVEKDSLKDDESEEDSFEQRKVQEENELLRTYDTLKEVALAFIANLNIKVSGLRVLLHDKDQVLLCSLSFCELSKLESEKDLNKEISFHNLVIASLKNPSFPDVVKIVNKGEQDLRFEKLLECVENKETRRQDLCSLLRNEGQTNEDSVHIRVSLDGGAFRMKVNLHSSFLVNLTVDSLKDLLDLSQIFTLADKEELLKESPRERGSSSGKKVKKTLYSVVFDEKSMDRNTQSFIGDKYASFGPGRTLFQFSVFLQEAKVKVQIDKEASLALQLKIRGFKFGLKSKDNNHLSTKFAVQQINLCKCAPYKGVEK